MKTLFLSVVFFLMIFSVTHAQDTIVRKNGEKIICEIIKEDSTDVYFNLTKKEQQIETHLSRSEIAEVRKENAAKEYYKLDVTSLGVGLGLDYGGIGLNFLFYPQKNIGIFVGGGYAIAGPGFNSGIKLRAVSHFSTSFVVPYLIAMYGYNAVVAVKNNPVLDKFFYGPTLGFGLDMKFRPSKDNFISLALLYPIRSSEVGDYTSNLTQNYNVTFKNSLSEVTFSIGFKSAF